MLYLIYGRENCDNFVLDTRIYFRKHKKPEWFEDPFVKEFLKEVDNTEVLFGEALMDYKGRGISTEMISTGCKTLCCIYFDKDNTIFYGSALGDNCYPFVMRMAKDRDITLVLEHYVYFRQEDFDSSLISCDGKIVDKWGYADAFSKWHSQGDPDYEWEDDD